MINVRAKACTQRYRPQPASPTPTASFWRCEDCGAWWGQRDLTDTNSDALYLLRAAEPALPWFAWDAFRGWRAASNEPQSCPDCDSTVRHPKLTLY